METKVIFKVSVWIDSNGLDFRVIEMAVKETTNSFVGEGRRISKDKLMQIDSLHHEHHASIRYFTYCKDGFQEQALRMLKEHTVSKVKQYKLEIDEMFKHIK